MLRIAEVFDQLRKVWSSCFINIRDSPISVIVRLQFCFLSYLQLSFAANRQNYNGSRSCIVHVANKFAFAEPTYRNPLTLPTNWRRIRCILFGLLVIRRGRTCNIVCRRAHVANAYVRVHYTHIIVYICAYDSAKNTVRLLGSENGGIDLILISRICDRDNGV